MPKKRFLISAGSALPFGATKTAAGLNFSLFSRHAEQVTLLLYASGRDKPVAEIALDPQINKTGDVWHILVHDLDQRIRYGYRLAGPYDPQGAGHYYSPGNILLDPYARALTGGTEWGVP